MDKSTNRCMTTNSSPSTNEELGAWQLITSKESMKTGEIIKKFNGRMRVGPRGQQEEKERKTTCTSADCGLVLRLDI